MSFENMEAGFFGGDVFDKCPNCGGQRLEDFRTSGVSGVQGVHCRDCGKNFKRRGGAEKFLDDKMEQGLQWSRDQGKRNRAFVFRNPMVIVIAFFWMIFLSSWVSLSRATDATGTKQGSIIGGTIFGTIILLIPAVLTLYYVRRRAPGSSYKLKDLIGADQRNVIIIAVVSAALTFWKLL